MTSKFSKIVYLFFILFSITSCRKDIMKMKTSVRRTQSEIKLYERTFSSLKRGLGLKENNASGTETEIDSNYISPIEQKNFLNNYDYIFKAINGEQGEIKSNNFEWDSIDNIYYVRDKKYKQIKTDKEVFGWHPHWMGESWKNYPFELLSTISYFSYVLDPETGLYSNSNSKQIEEWKSTALIDSAKAKGTRVLLTVSSHGLDNNTTFLNSEQSWETLIETVSQLLLEKNADGIDLNFELLPYSKRENFNKFVSLFRKRMSEKFLENGKTFFLSITLPALNTREIFDITELQKHADLLVIMGYDYNTGNQIQGAVAPLRSSENLGISLSNTLEYYIESGIDLSKTVLALPYYGSIWNGELDSDNLENNNLTINTKFERKATYSEIRKILIDKKEFNSEYFLDERSMTNYYNITYADKTTKEIWFDDAYTLRKKYNYAMSENLKGVGIWALGYDNGYNDLWEVIEDEFSTDKKVFVNPITEAEGYPIRITKLIYKYRDLMVVAALFCLFSIIVGLIILLSDWRIRDSLIRNQINRLIFVILVFIFLTPIIAVINDWLFLKSSWKIYAAFIIGAITIYLSSKIKIDPFKRP